MAKDFFKFYQIDKISPNLITLGISHESGIASLDTQRYDLESQWAGNSPSIIQKTYFPKTFGSVSCLKFELSEKPYNIYVERAILGLFFVLFSSFQTNIITILATNKCEKCPSSIWCRDLNSRPAEHKSPP